MTEKTVPSKNSIYKAAQDYTITETGQKLLDIYINYFLKRGFLKPNRDALIRQIGDDNPNMHYKERLKIVGMIISEVKKLRGSSK